jgi:transcriptional regulator with XRE-family HTH domain
MHIYLRYKLDMKTEQIGKRLREVRIDARLTQREMAKLVNLSTGSIGAMENGLYTPNFDVLRAIHKKLGVSYDYIIDGLESNENPSKLIEENARLKEELERMRKIVDKLVK